MKVAIAAGKADLRRPRETDERFVQSEPSPQMSTNSNAQKSSDGLHNTIDAVAESEQGTLLLDILEGKNSSGRDGSTRDHNQNIWATLAQHASSPVAKLSLRQSHSLGSRHIVSTALPCLQVLVAEGLTNENARRFAVDAAWTALRAKPLLMPWLPPVETKADEVGD